jgi:molecular chaperone GrpE
MNEDTDPDPGIDGELVEGKAPEAVAADNNGSAEAGFKDRYLRLAAEFDNYRKRTEREMVEFKKRAADDVLLALLDVLDSLDRALESSDACEPSDLAEGLLAIRGQMGDILNREGVEPIDAVGNAFDPFEMEAVMRMPSDTIEADGVIRELQKGYRGRGYVLRPSKVIVSAGPQQPEETPHEDPDERTDSGENEVKVTRRK